jgi:hypothetical protein
MGRYAYFSNGFEYKFWFCIQDSKLDVADGIDVTVTKMYYFNDVSENPHKYDDGTDDSKEFIQLANELPEMIDQEVMECNIPSHLRKFITADCVNPDMLSFNLTIDQERVYADIQGKCSDLDIPIPDIHQYSLDDGGTYDLQDYFNEYESEEYLNRYNYRTGEQCPLDEYKRYVADLCLACVLYHQGQFNGWELSGQYEC